MKSNTSSEGNFDNLKVEMIGLQEEVEFASEAMKIFVKDPSIVRPFRWRYEYLLHNHFSSEIGKINAMCSEFKGHVVFKDGTVLCYVDKMNPFSKKKSKDTMAKAIRTFASEKLIRLPINSSAVPDWLQPLFGDTNGNKNAFLLKKYLMQNYRFFLAVMKSAFDSDDHQTAMMLYMALTHMSIERLDFKRPKRAKEKLDSVAKTYGSVESCYNKHVTEM